MTSKKDPITNVSHLFWLLDRSLDDLISFCNANPNLAEHVTQEVESRIAKWNNHICTRNQPSMIHTPPLTTANVKICEFQLLDEMKSITEQKTNTNTNVMSETMKHILQSMNSNFAKKKLKEKKKLTWAELDESDLDIISYTTTPRALCKSSNASMLNEPIANEPMINDDDEKEDISKQLNNNTNDNNIISMDDYKQPSLMNKTLLNINLSSIKSTPMNFKLCSSSNIPLKISSKHLKLPSTSSVPLTIISSPSNRNTNGNQTWASLAKQKKPKYDSYTKRKHTPQSPAFITTSLPSYVNVGSDGSVTNSISSVKSIKSNTSSSHSSKLKVSNGWSHVLYRKKKKKMQKRKRSTQLTEQSLKSKFDKAQNRRQLQQKNQRLKNEKRLERHKVLLAKQQKENAEKIEQMRIEQEARADKAQVLIKEQELKLKQAISEHEVRGMKIRMANYYAQQCKKTAMLIRQVKAQRLVHEKLAKISLQASKNDQKRNKILQSQIKDNKDAEEKMLQKLENAEMRHQQKMRDAKEKLNTALKKIKERDANKNKNNKNANTNKNKKFKSKKKKKNTYKKRTKNNKNTNKKSPNNFSKLILNEKTEILNTEKYYDMSEMQRMHMMYYPIPKLNTASAVIAKKISYFYTKTKSLHLKIQNKSASTPSMIYGEIHDWKCMEDGLRELLKDIIKISSMKDIHYNNDILLILHRLFLFDINFLPFKCCKLYIHIVSHLTRNICAIHFITIGYLSKFMMYLKYALNEYFYLKNDKYYGLLPQLLFILTQCYEYDGGCIDRFFYSENILEKEKNGNTEKYKKYKKHFISYLLVTLFNNSLIIFFSNFFNNLPNTKSNSNAVNIVFMSILDFLIPIPHIFKYFSETTDILSKVQMQIKKSQCCGILSFLSQLVFDSFQAKVPKMQDENEIKRHTNNVTDDTSTVFNDKTIKLLTKSLTFLNEVGYTDNGFQQLLQSLILENEMEFYHILSILLAYNIPHFMNEEIDGKGNVCVWELCKYLLEFMSVITFKNIKIQDMFRYGQSPTLINRLISFPFFFFLSADGQMSLFPTLIHITVDNVINLELLKHFMSTEHIRRWLIKNCVLFYKIHGDVECEESVKQVIYGRSGEKKNGGNDGKCVGWNIGGNDRLKNEIFIQKIPPHMWQKCFQIYV